MSSQISPVLSIINKNELIQNVVSFNFIALLRRFGILKVTLNLRMTLGSLIITMSKLIKIQLVQYCMCVIVY